MKLADDGRDPGRSDDLFDGYWHEPRRPQVAPAIADGWLRTGDVGEWQDDALRLVDRARDFIVTAGGKTLSPSFIENLLRASPYVGEAMVIGHARKYLTALIEIDFDTRRRLGARRRRHLHRLHQPCEASAACSDCSRARSTRVNRSSSRVEQIKAFRILPKALDPEEEGEPVTPTRKLKRAQHAGALRARSSKPCMTTTKSNGRRRRRRRPENLTDEGDKT